MHIWLLVFSLLVLSVFTSPAIASKSKSPGRLFALLALAASMSIYSGFTLLRGVATQCISAKAGVRRAHEWVEACLSPDGAIYFGLLILNAVFFGFFVFFLLRALRIRSSAVGDA